jgi:hypothetical protein
MSKVIAGFFCDDIRQEVNGKLLFIGCYSGVMNVSQFPFVFRVGAVAIINAPINEVQKITCRYKMKGGEELARTELAIESVEVPNKLIPDHSLIPMPPQIVRVSGPDALELWVKLDGGRDHKAASLVIEAPGMSESEEVGGLLSSD